MTIQFASAEQLQYYIASIIADFVRDNMFELNKHPMDYEDHYEYIIKLYTAYMNRLTKVEVVDVNDRIGL